MYYSVKIRPTQFSLNLIYFLYFQHQIKSKSTMKTAEMAAINPFYLYIRIQMY